MLHKRFTLSAPDVGLALSEVERFREHLALLDCPSCTQNALKLVDYVQGPTGWACKVFCVACKSKGEINSEGFHVELAEAKEQPREEKQKTKSKR